MSNPGIFGQPDPVNYDFEFFARGPRSGASATKNFERFDIPRHARFLDIIAIGSGGPGGNGFTRIAGAAGGGGGGGASAPRVQLRVATRFLPSELWVQVPVAAPVGTAGFGVIILLRSPGVAANPPDLLLSSQTTGGNNGGNGTGAAAGANGGIGTIGTALLAYMSQFGVVSFSQGIPGTAGGLHTGATPAAQTQMSGGAGGGGTTSANFAGAAVNAWGPMPLNPGGAAGTNNGNTGAVLRQPEMYQGGSGGGSNNTGPGGNGGNGGGYGTGGGGGGAGTTGGTGGFGGDGHVWILCS